MAGRTPYALRFREPWVGSTRRCGCAPRWMRTIGGYIRHCHLGGKLIAVHVSGGYPGHLHWQARMRGFQVALDEEGQRMTPPSTLTTRPRTGFKTSESAKRWVMSEFARMCEGGR